jgi:ABC-2 type transport system permease protein
MDSGTPTHPAVKLKSFHAPKTVIRRFVLKRSYKSVLLWGFIFAVYMFSKASGFVSVYPTMLSREKLAQSLGSNVGVEALLGVAHRLETVGGYAVWNFLCLIAAAGAIWALLIVTKTLRGDEEAGRWELLLAGQTTARRATANALAGLGAGLVIIYLMIVLALFSIGTLHGADFTTSGCLFFGLALIAGAAEFLAVGALASQLMPVRSRAAGLSAIVFGIFYVLRLAADTTNAHWLLNVSPLGWIERLQPMYNSQPIWLLPIGVFVAVLSALAIFLAGRRDLGAAAFADKDAAKPHNRLLVSPLKAAIRLTRATTLSWLAATGLMAFVYGMLANGASKAFAESSSAEHILSRLSDATKVATATAFMGIVFFIIMVLVMFYAASAVGRIRADEAQGYIDNFLVRPVSRMKWLWGRICLIVGAVIAAGILSSVMAWAGEASQHCGISFHSLLLAGANAMTPVIFVVGIGIFALGIIPRLTNALTYGAIGWSFLIVMLSSGLTINHWLLDSSVLHHIVLAPTVSPNWHTDLIIICLSAVLCLAGTLVFNKRDLQAE